MTEERLKELLLACVQYINEQAGGFEDPYRIMSDVLGFTEEEYTVYLDEIKLAFDKGECDESIRDR